MFFDALKYRKEQICICSKLGFLEVQDFFKRPEVYQFFKLFVVS